MQKKFTDRAARVMKLANRHALELGHEYLIGGHILFAIATEGNCWAGKILAAHIAKRSDSSGNTAAAGLEAIQSRLNDRMTANPDVTIMGKVPHSQQAKRVVDFALEEAEVLDRPLIGSEHLLLGLLRDAQDESGEVLRELEVELDAIRSAVSIHSSGEEAANAQKIIELATVDEGLFDNLLNGNLNGELNQKAIRVLTLAEAAARAQSDTTVWTQHVLIGLVEEATSDAAFCLKNRGITAARVKAKAFEMYPLLESAADLEPTTRMIKSEYVKQALIRAGELADKVINAEHLMLGLLQPADTPEDKIFNSTVILKELRVDIEIFREELNDFQRTAPKPSPVSDIAPATKQTLVAEPDCLAESAYSQPMKSEKTTTINRVGRDLTRWAFNDNQPAVAINEETLERILAVLLRRNRNNVLLVADPRRSRIYFEAIAHRLIGDAVPASFFNHRLVEIFACEYGYEEKFSNSFCEMLNESRRDHNVLLALESIEDLVHFKSPFRSKHSLLEAVHPWLELPSVRLIGTCSPAEIEKVSSLTKVISEFEVITLSDSDFPATDELLRHFVNLMEDFHVCTFAQEAIETSRKICEIYCPGDDTLHESLMLLDQAAADFRLTQLAIKQDGDSKKENYVTVEVQKLDRRLSSAIKSKLTCLEEGDWEVMRAFDNHYESLLQRRLGLQALPQIVSENVIQAFCNFRDLQAKEVRNRIGTD